jgi:flagellar export protein FliJ
MRPFKFRALAALHLRRREHDRALAALAAAQTGLVTARQALDETTARLAHADGDFEKVLRADVPGHMVPWYRSWSVRLQQARDACDARRRVAELDVERAEALVAEARQKVQSLERLHDLALAAWEREAQREDQKLMDALATVRFTRREERTAS